MTTVILDVPTVPLSLRDALNYIKFAYATGTGLGTLKDAIADNDDGEWGAIVAAAAKPTPQRKDVYRFTVDDLKNAVRIANSWIMTTDAADGFLFAKVNTKDQQVLPLSTIRNDGVIACAKYQQLLAGAGGTLEASPLDAKTVAALGDEKVWSLAVDTAGRLCICKSGVTQVAVTTDGRIWNSGVNGFLAVVPSAFSAPEALAPELRTIWPPQHAATMYQGWRIAVSYLGHLAIIHGDTVQAVLFSEGEWWLAGGGGFAAPAPGSSPSLPVAITPRVASFAIHATPNHKALKHDLQ